MILSKLKIYLLLLSVSLAASCAKTSSPSGGPVDEEPPRVLDSQPPNGSVNFSSRSFKITFDEYFVLDNIDQALMVSPPLEKKPLVKTRGKTMIVELDEEEELNENKTYAFNFLNSIKDLNENNPLENFKYVFSTGDVIDSLSVTGHIYDAYNLEAGEEILLMLHAALPDSMPESTLPDYITRAGENGSYRIDNVAAGEYKIYGLKDDNNNKLYDLPGEAFAFLDSSIYVSPENNYIPVRPDSLVAPADSGLLAPADTAGVGAEEPGPPADSLRKDRPAIDTLGRDPIATDPRQGYPQGGELPVSAATRADSMKYERIPGKEVELYYFVAERKTQYLTGSSRPQPYLLQFTFAIPVDTSSIEVNFIESGNDEEYTGLDVDYIREFSAGKDTCRLWLTDSSYYSRERITLLLGHPRTDSLGQLQAVTDTIRLRYRAPAAGRSRAPARQQTATLTLKTNISQASGLKPEQNPVFVFDTPMLEPDTSRIKLYLQNDSLEKAMDYRVYRDSVNNKKFIFRTRLDPDSMYVLLVHEGAFENIYGLTNDSLNYKFRVRNPEQLGKLVVNITGFNGNIILQLLDAGENIVIEKKISLPSEGSVEFPYLDSKEYLVKAIFDLNGDGKWTTGDYDKKRQPEPVSYLPKKIDVKAGWEMIEDWHLDGIRKKEEAISSTRGAKKGKR
ncbi:MAG: Ig-like domain-containing protein [Bacteroidota bacterium]